MRINCSQKIPRENFHAKRLHMNERIKELMIKADYPAPELALRAQALVELIVRECVEVCHKMAEDSDSYVVHDGDTCAEQIREHFGVEE